MNKIICLGCMQECSQDHTNYGVLSSCCGKHTRLINGDLEI